MSGTAAKAEAPRSARAIDRAWLVVLAALWLPLLWRLTAEWSANVEQFYGWAVPVLAVFFAKERARWMPPAGPLGKGSTVAAWTVMMSAVACLPVASTILDANTSWPAAQWVTYALVAGVTLSAVALAGGGRMAGHFLFPVLFVATALTWPAFLTTRLGIALGGFNAQLATAVVSAAGYPAVVNGTVIEVTNGWVGVDEACSGLRSMQAAVMAGLFFGELFLLSRMKRLALGAAAAAVAVVANAIRTTLLTWLAASDSIAASAAWHDRAGGLELVATLGGIAVLARWFGRDVRARPAASGVKLPVRRALQWTLLVGGLAGAVAPVLWFGKFTPEARGPDVQWELVRSDVTWTPIEIPERAMRLLRPDSASGLVRREGAGRARSYALLVRWDGKAGRGLSANLHDPTICLPASGRDLEVLEDDTIADVSGVPVRFTVGRFFAEGRVQHVYYCHWDARLGQARDFESESLVDIPRWRLARALDREAGGGAAFLAFVVPTAERAEAEEWVKEWAPLLLRRR